MITSSFSLASVEPDPIIVSPFLDVRKDWRRKVRNSKQLNRYWPVDQSSHADSQVFGIQTFTYDN